MLTLWFVVHVHEAPADDPPEGAAAGIREAPAEVWRILREAPQIRRLVAASALLEATVAAMKTFAVLYITVGLGRSMGFTSLALAVVAASVVAGALASGRLADRMGHARVLRLAVPVYAAGLTVPLLGESAIVLAAVPLAAGAAGVVLTLPYAALMGLMPEERHGALAGVFEAGRGVGVLAGPVLAGIAVQLSAGALPARGFSAAFGVAALAALAAIPLVWRLKRSERGA